MGRSKLIEGGEDLAICKKKIGVNGNDNDHSIVKRIQEMENRDKESRRKMETINRTR